MAYSDPFELGTILLVSEFLVPLHGVGYVIFFLEFADFEAERVGRDFARQIKLGGLVDFVADKAFELVNAHC